MLVPVDKSVIEEENRHLDDIVLSLQQRSMSAELEEGPPAKRMKKNAAPLELDAANFAHIDMTAVSP
eukprot:8984332-Pyramimonas_sp.AAC.1